MPTRRDLLRNATLAAAALPAVAGASADRPSGSGKEDFRLESVPGAKPLNLVLILADDHRYDAMSFMGHPFVRTPHLDALAAGGAHFKNAFVTTALCSPSRATILTGLYAHQHKVVDNNNPVLPGTVFFPQYLQAAGYATGFVGKWHMGGDSDEPRPGFEHWVSFKGQGSYLPNKNGLNVNGQRVPQKGYITDELTDYAVEWLDGLKGDRPFLLYLAHKAVHADFVPAERHKGAYGGAKVEPPASQADTEENYRGKPMWVRNQRNSWHGVDFPYHSELDVAEYYRRYCETLLAVDDSTGRLVAWLKNKGLLDSTLILYTTDNGFMFGEHGLIDKRAAYEPSTRVPMILHCPAAAAPGTVVDDLAANLDVAPTFLEAAGLRPPPHMVGRSLLSRLRAGDGDASGGVNGGGPWRDHLLYEYFWERNFPHTPTMHAIRTGRYKFVRYHGVWDTDELYDLQDDPGEMNNLILSPDHKDVAARLRDRLFATLAETGGLSIPLYPDRGGSQNLRRTGGSKPADFPPHMVK